MSGTAEAPRPGQPGGDGVRAWTIALTVAVANGFGFGVAYSFGAFFEAMADEFGAGLGATALVFSITIFLFFGLGVVSGPLADRIGPRPLVGIGAVLMPLGLLATARVEQLWLGYVTYGVGVGLACGLFVTPLIAAVGGWFQRSRALALGVASAGNGLGTLLLVPAADRLIHAHGWRTAYTVLAAAAAVILGAATLVVRRPPVTQPPPAVEHLRRVAATRSLRILFASGLLMSVALFVAFAFIVPFATDDGVSSSGAALLVGLVGASSIAGRVGIAALARDASPVRLYQASLAVQPLAYTVWLVAGGRYGLLVAFAVLLGISYGGFVALGPEVCAYLFGVVGLGGVLGVLFLGAGLGGLVGPPLAGWLADTSDGHTLPILVALVATVMSTGLTFVLSPRPVLFTAGAPAVDTPG